MELHYGDFYGTYTYIYIYMYIHILRCKYKHTHLYQLSFISLCACLHVCLADTTITAISFPQSPLIQQQRSKKIPLHHISYGSFSAMYVYIYICTFLFQIFNVKFQIKKSVRNIFNNRSRVELPPAMAFYKWPASRHI